MRRFGLVLAVGLGCRVDAGAPADTDAVDTDVVDSVVDTDVVDTVVDTDVVVDVVDSEVGPDTDPSGDSGFDSGWFVDPGTGQWGDSAADTDTDTDTGGWPRQGTVGATSDLWSPGPGLDDFHRYAYDVAAGRGYVRAGSDRCVLPDGRELDRVWVSYTGFGGYAGEWRYFDPVTHALVGALAWSPGPFGPSYPVRGWYGENLAACSPRPLPALPRSLCLACGAHPGCTAFTLAPYDAAPVDAWTFELFGSVLGGQADCPHRCGDGILQDEEGCDDGGLVAGDGCDDRCRVEGCGDGVVDLGEACDDGNAVEGDGCGVACRVERCGDGIVQRGRGEDCDDGDPSATDGCDADCHVRVHGLVNTRYGLCGLADDGTPACFGDDPGLVATAPDVAFDRLVGGFQTVCGLVDGVATCWGDRSRVYGSFPETPFGPVRDLGPGTPTAWLDLGGRVVGPDVGWSLPSGRFTRLRMSVNGGVALDEASGRAVVIGSCAGGCWSPAGPALVAVDEEAGNVCGLRDDGSVVCWGRNDRGQRGAPTTGTYTQVATGWATSCALRDDGRVQCWGAGGVGTLPAGKRLRELLLVEARVGTVVGCGVDEAGVLSCWSSAASGTRLPTHGW